MKTKLFFTICLFVISTISIAQNPELWGMTQSGGANSRGAIFKINGDGTGFSLQYSFINTGSSGQPKGNLFQANDGKFYGMNQLSGSAGKGQLFRFNPSTNVYSPLIDFVGPNGASPTASVMQATNGKLYGMAPLGGTGGFYQWGDIFSFSIPDSQFVDLYNFSCTSTVDGGEPFGNLIQATNGKLYGMTSFGGINSSGVIFSFDIPTSTCTKVFDLNSALGEEPLGSLIQANNGKLYGMTSRGGANNFGVIFSFDFSSGSYTKLLDFNNANGKSPHGSLIQATNGKLYGMTQRGGSDSVGVIFTFDISSNTYAKLYDFDTTNGKWPNGSLMQASNGKLYGMTGYGGSNNYGVVFSFDPTTNNFTNLFSCNYPTGAIPNGDLTEYNPTVGINEISNSTIDLNVFPNPFSSETILKVNKNLKDATLIIYNLFGQETKRLTAISGSELKIKRENLSIGIYFIRLSDESKVIATSKLIITN